MARTTPKQDTSHAQEPACGSALVAWVLLLMGLAAFAPCILLPEWRAYQQVVTAEQAQRHKVGAIERVVERQRLELEALGSDPAVVARLAQRELSFQTPGGMTVPVRAFSSDQTGASTFKPIPVSLPRALARPLSYLPEFNYDAVFCDARTRTIVMVMSVGLMLVALGLPGRSFPQLSHRR